MPLQKLMEVIKKEKHMQGRHPQQSHAGSSKTYEKGKPEDMIGLAKIGRLPKNLSISDINRLVGFKSDRPSYKDRKTTIEWIVKGDKNQVVSVYNYKKFRWSIGGNAPDLAKEIFGDLFKE